MSTAKGRRLEHAAQFTKKLQSFAKKKDPGLPERVQKALTSRLEQGPGNDPRLQRVKDLSVFKMRVKAQGRGKSGFARVVHYLNQKRLLALSIFLKSEKADMGPADRQQIEEALQASGLWPGE